MEEHKERRKDCPEDWMVAALIMNELDPARSQELTKHISSCSSCMERAAIYYKASLKDATLTVPKKWLERAVDRLQGDRKSLRKRPSLLTHIQDIIESLPPLPGYAVAAVAVVLLIWISLSDKSTVVTIASSQKIIFKDAAAPSSFGFMGHNIVEAKDDMLVSAKRGKVILNWKPIDGATEYSLTIKDKIDGDIIIATLQLMEPGASIPESKFKKGELYTWVISGKAAGDKEFEYSGEFVLAK